MSISAEEVKKLRLQTGAGIMDCKEALKVSKGDFSKACDFIKKKGLAKAAKKSSREASEGSITSYIHQGGKLGVLLEVNTETDFVARNETFKSFTHSLSMHIAAMNPLFLSEEEILLKTEKKKKKKFLKLKRRIKLKILSLQIKLQKVFLRNGWMKSVL